MFLFPPRSHSLGAIFILGILEPEPKTKPEPEPEPEPELESEPEP